MIIYLLALMQCLRHWRFLLPVLGKEAADVPHGRVPGRGVRRRTWKARA